MDRDNAIVASEEIFLGRQPILDREQRLVAYELLFRSGLVVSSDVTDDSHATRSVISNAFGQIGAGAVLGPHKGYINVNAEMLYSDLIELLPKRQIVIELLETVNVTADVVQRCRDLRARGFMLALDDFVFDDTYVPLLEIVDVVKLDLLQHGPAELEGAVRMLSRWPVKLLAEKVETEAQATSAVALGFDLFQGYYFASPSVLRTPRHNTASVPVMKLLELTLRDADVRELEDVFKHSPELTYRLLRLVNSAACGAQRTISSVTQAVVLLGLGPLQRWLQLLLFTSDPGAEYPSPLMQLAATRARLMENLAALERPGDRSLQDKAFMTGLLSLLDVLLGLPREEIIAQLGLAQEIADALLDGEGVLARLLKVARKVEEDNCAAAKALLTQFTRLNLNDLTQAHLEALAWVNGIAETTVN